MNWQQLCENPDLQNLPYKIELNEKGQIIMSPARLMHRACQSDIAIKIGGLKKGKIVTECAIQTRKGTKVTDAAWFSSDRWKQVMDEYDSPVAPEICVEVLPPHNSAKEMRSKKRLYFEKGAEEVWFCDEEGNMSFYIKKRKIGKSRLVPEFSKKIM